MKARRTAVFFLIFAAVCCLTMARDAAAQAPTPGQNVNMVSGTKWPFGDPFLQRQNEPSIAVSTRNERHLLAGANDYRTVDLPAADIVPGPMSADAWLGVFKSFDGGQTWQSTLLPGYPQDKSPEGMASPLKGFGTAADPTVRSSTNGLFLYSGIALNRGTNLGVVFVARYMDLNNKENGDVSKNSDPIRYIDTVVVDSGTSGQFLDKTWILVDAPMPGGPTCSIAVPTGSGQTTQQNIPAGAIYLVWSRFTGSTSTKIMMSRSMDCGKTWGQPIKVSESNSINQGTIGAIDPVTHDVYLFWRRFKTNNQTDAILYVKSSDFGRTFTKSSEIATIIPFDQATTSGSFRTNVLPTAAVSVDSNNASYVHVAWAARKTTGGESRVLMSSSANGGKTWSTPAAIDDGAILDDTGTQFARGHQFMPQMTAVGGLVSVVYYDTRLDHTLGNFRPQTPFAPYPNGSFYQESRLPKGELPSNPNSVFTPFITDSGLTLRRHTVDVRLAQAKAGPALAQATPPAGTWAYSTVSRYAFGLPPDASTTDDLKQLQVNPPNFPLFQQGTVPFIGDYIDIAGLAFVLDPVTGAWKFNVAPSKLNAVYTTWTDNRDVRPPADGNWTNYTPVGGGGPSIFDPTQNTPTCASGQEGMRNQNIYSSRITQGLLVSSPQNSKPLSTTIQRAFVVVVQNSTDFDKSFQMKIANQPSGGVASFLQMGFQDTLNVPIPAHSGAARTVFATSNNPKANITVNVDEISGQPPALVPNGLSGFILLNGDPTIAPIEKPDGATQDISTVEIYNANISNANISNANISNTSGATANISNANISNANISNANISNGNISNQDIANLNISNANISNVNIADANISNANISNANISNANISNDPISDATYSLTNTGNTSTSYTVKLIGNTTVPAGALQLIVRQPYQNPVSVDCNLQQQGQNKPLTNIATAPSGNYDLSVPDAAGNATFALAPGETVLITLRGVGVDTSTIQESTTASAPATFTQAAGPGGTSVAVPLLIATNDLPPGTVGKSYSATLSAIGGTSPYTSWCIVEGVLPTGLTFTTETDLATNLLVGRISGTPAEATVRSLRFQVTDSTASGACPLPDFSTGTARRALTLTVNVAGTIVEITDSPDPTVTGQPYTITATVTADPLGSITPSGSVTIDDGAGNTCTPTLTQSSPGVATASCESQPMSAGSKALTANYPGVPGQFTGNSAAGTHTVNPANTTTTLTDAPDPSLTGQAVTVSWTVAVNAPGSGTPTGTVTVSDGNGATCSGSGVSGSCEITFTTAGIKTLTANYSGDANYNGSSDTETHIVKANTITTITSDAPDPSLLFRAVVVNFTVVTDPPGGGTPTGSVLVTDGNGASCSATVAVGSCTLTPTSVGFKTLTATYAGNDLFNGSSDTESHQVIYLFTGFYSPMNTAGTCSALTSSGIQKLGNALPIKWQLQDGNGSLILDLGTIISLEAFNGTGCGTPGAGVLLYSPTAGAKGGSEMRVSSGQFIFNWNTGTGTAAGTYTVVLRLSDGTVRATTIQLKP